MSLAALQSVMALGPEVSGARRLILIALADNMNDEGYSYPKRRTIANKAGIRRLDTVTEQLGWLETNGYIVRKVNAWAGTLGDIPADKRPNVYRFTDKILRPTATTGSPDPGDPQAGPSTDVADGVSPESADGPLPGIRGPEPSLRTTTRTHPPTPRRTAQAEEPTGEGVQLALVSDEQALRFTRFFHQEAGTARSLADIQAQAKLWTRDWLVPSARLTAEFDRSYMRPLVEWVFRHEHWSTVVATPADLARHHAKGHLRSQFEAHLAAQNRAKRDGVTPTTAIPAGAVAACRALYEQVRAMGYNTANLDTALDGKPLWLRQVARNACELIRTHPDARYLERDLEAKIPLWLAGQAALSA